MGAFEVSPSPSNSALAFLQSEQSLTQQVCHVKIAAIFSDPEFSSAPTNQPRNINDSSERVETLQGPVSTALFQNIICIKTASSNYFVGQF